MKRKFVFVTFCLAITFVSKSQLPTILTSAASTITTTSAICGGDVTDKGGSAVTDKGIVYSTTANPTTADTKISSGTGTGLFSVAIPGLTNNTTYHVRAYAVNTTGTNYGNDVVFTTTSGAPQGSLEEIKTKLKELDAINSFIANQKSSIFKFGISVAVRTAFDNSNEKQARAFATITPNDNLVSIDYNDMMAVVISTTVAAYPFKIKKDADGNTLGEPSKLSKFFSNFGFLANINLVEFADSKTTTVFNKQVDGGMGFSYLLGNKQQFAVALTYERISVRQPTQFVFDHLGKQITGDNGTALTSLDVKDPRFYRDAGMNGMSLKFVFHFN